MSALIQITQDDIDVCVDGLAEEYPEHDRAEMAAAALNWLEAATLLLAADPATYIRYPAGQFSVQWQICLKRAERKQVAP